MLDSTRRSYYIITVKDKTISFRTTEALRDRFHSKIPKEGDRSVVLRQLLLMFLDGKIVLPEIKRP